ncbi:MAG: hypothetical protein CMA68_01590 [Euryarchaeota archaeon]|nr:hypothetical protein [Euryarchaeota archaeon]
MDGEDISKTPGPAGTINIDISDLDIGSHALKVVAIDSLGQETSWSKAFIVHYPDESETRLTASPTSFEIERGGDAPIFGLVAHDDITTCELRWSTADIEDSSLGLPLDNEGNYELELTNIQENTTVTLEATCGTWTETTDRVSITIVVAEPPEPPVQGCTDSAANNYDEGAEEDDDSCEYDEPAGEVETGSQEWWEGILLCDSTEQVEGIDDYNTSGFDNHVCQLSFTTNETHIEIISNGLPNHDLESGPGCCSSAQEHVWEIPLEPTNQTGCNPSVSTDGCTMAPERGAVAFAVNGVPIFGPEDGPGGDAVAGQEGAYEEDRQHVWLGICHAHSGPGGEYHYHADSNCLHWHPDEENGETWADYSMESSRTVASHSPIVGFALDGYPIYGFVGWDVDGEVSEMTSSYRLKDGETGYNGIDDYEYVSGLGDLDSCNGQFGATPDYPDGIYHYHTTWVNGEGGIGFPYFINCYRGVMESGGTGNGGGDVDCTGHGETWGPGIGPPPDGCGGGPPGQSSDMASAIAAISNLVPPNGGSILAALSMAVIVIRGLASDPASPSRAGIAVGYRPDPV